MSAYSRSADQIEWRRLAAYALPGCALAIPLIPAQVLLPSHYAQNTATGLAVTGLVLLAARLLDVVSDPIIGWVTDQVIHAGKGFRRLLAAGALLCGISLFFLFTPPAEADWPYLLVWSGLLFLGWSAVQIPYTVWAARLTMQPQSRLWLNGGREAAVLAGLVASSLFIALWPADSDSQRLRDLALATVTLGGLAIAVLLAFVPRPALTEPAAGSEQALSGILRNKPAVRLIAAWFLNGMANALPAVCFALYVTLVLGGDEQQRGLFLLLYFLCAVLAIPFWMLAGRRLDKHRLWCLAMLGAVAAFVVVPFLGEGAFVAFGVICVITGFALGADLAIPPAIQADVADWDRLRFRRSRTGLLFSIWSMATKLAFGAAAGLAFPLLAAFGVSDDASSITEQGGIALAVIYAGVPVVIKLLAIALVWSFPLTSGRMVLIRKRLSATPT